MKTKRSWTRVGKALFLAPLFFAIVAGGGLLSKRQSVAAPAAKNRIDVPVDPQLSGDGRLVAAAIQMRDRFHYIDDQGRKDYVDKVVGNEVRFWNAKTLTPLRPLPLPSTPAQLALSPDASLLAISGDEFRVVDVVTRKVLWSQNDARSTVLSSEPVEPGMKVVYAPHGLRYPVFSPDGRSLAVWDIAIDGDTGATQVAGYLFDARTGAILARWPGAPGDRLNGTVMRFSPDSRLLVSSEVEPRVFRGSQVPFARPQIRDARDGKVLRTLPFNGPGISDFGPNNRLLLFIGSEYTATLSEVDAETGQRLWTHPILWKDSNGQLRGAEAAFYSVDRKRIALPFRGSKSVQILDARSGKLLQVIQVSAAPGAPYTDDGAFAFAPGGGALLVMKQGVVSLHKIK